MNTKKHLKVVILVSFVLFVILLDSVSFASPGDHPSIWVNSENITALRTRMTTNTPQWRNLKEWCDSHVPIGGNSIEVKKDGIVNNAMVYLMTGDSTYADAALYWMNSIYSSYVFSANHVHINLQGMAIGYDWLYNYAGFTSGLKATYVTWMNSLTDQMVAYYLYNYEFGNYAQRYMEAELLVGYATWGDNANASTYVTHADSKWTGIKACHTIADVGGGRYEGENYAAGVWPAVLRYAAAKQSVAGEDVYSGNAFFEDRLKFLIYSLHTTATGTKGFRNGDFRGDRQYLYNVREQLVMLGEKYYDTYGKYAYWILNNTTDINTNVTDMMQYGGHTYDFIWYNPSRSGSNISALPLAYEGNSANGAGLKTMRSDWTSDTPTWIGFICGNWFGGGHQGLDQNSFQIYSHGGDLAIDSGSYDTSGTGDHMRNYAGRTIAHNSMLILDPNEHWDNSIRGSNVYANDGGQRSFDPMSQSLTTAAQWETYRDRCELATLERFETTNDYTYLLGNATNAYNNPAFQSDPDEWPKNGSKLTNFTRQFIYLRPNTVGGNEYIAIFDRVTSTNA